MQALKPIQFVGTSISSDLSAGWIETYRKALKANPHVKHLDDRQGGYVRCTLDKAKWRSEFLLADSLDDRLSPVRKVASFEVYPQADPRLRKGTVRVYRERRWGWVAAVVAGVLFIIVALIALFVSGFD